jgi:hypothetical protein
MKVIRFCANLLEAELVASFLRGSGIEAVVLDTHSATVAFHHFGTNNVRVAVPESEWDEAQELLEDALQKGLFRATDDSST